ncbi:PREDICTED: putative F-box/LRR-repeat protein 23 [Camelina sativa]|uniref:F-box/LRR-repeat protein 23 n=1 Tax=Camelina sativa TaxID=90675 RepID=A0ABM1QC60_CAMSA|nr:PREDICTED: putative F-box/LRR-repeat protein 23 [Camelina sativa]
MEEYGEECRNWAELPPEITSSILVRLGAIEILENAQKVCKSWRRVCKDPSMWRKIDIDNRGDLASFKYDLFYMCCHAVDRSQGGLVEIDLWYFGTNRLLGYIADSSSNLRTLRLVRCRQITDKGVAKAVAKLPLLEDLEISYCYFSGERLSDIGKSCQHLKTLKLNRRPRVEFALNMRDHNAIAIAESMPELRHLQLLGNALTNAGLNAILDGCPHLEHLDLRQCSNIHLVGDLEKRCLEKVKVLRRPNDSTADYPYDTSVLDTDSYDGIPCVLDHYVIMGGNGLMFRDDLMAGFDLIGGYNNNIMCGYDSDTTSSSSSSSTSVSTLINDEELGNWAELPPELISSILGRLTSIDILENAQKVCRSWRQVCKDPSMWRKIDMDNLGDLGAMGYDLEIMCRHSPMIDFRIFVCYKKFLLHLCRSSSLSLIMFITFLLTIICRSSNLRILRLIMCYPIADEGFIEAIVKLPLIEYLELSHCSLSGESLRVVGKSCPNLRTLKLNSKPDPNFNDDEFNNDDALAIAESMPELRHLQLFGNILTNVGLNAILDGCPHLEHLDLRKCFNVDLTGNLGKRCSERIKDLRRPNDSTAGHPYGGTSIVDAPRYDPSDYYCFRILVISFRTLFERVIAVRMSIIMGLGPRFK